MVENIARNGEICLLQAISPFLTKFSTAFYLQCIKMRQGVVMGSTLIYDAQDRILQNGQITK